MHRDCLRFLWFDVFSDSPEVVQNRFARVIFWRSSYLLNQTIRKHTESYAFDMNFVNKVVDSFYVDDFSWGEHDFELFKNQNLDSWRDYSIYKNGEQITQN